MLFFIEILNIVNCMQFYGKEFLYNNIFDSDSVIEFLKEFDEFICVVIKYNNLCVVVLVENINEVYKKVYESDLVLIFGGIVVFNRKVDKDIVEQFKKIFFEIVIVLEFDEDVFFILCFKKDLRVLKLVFLEKIDIFYDIKFVNGGVLI